jgi:FKBP-type peptidyl-prolyl cis-trans isomerase 2
MGIEKRFYDEDEEIHLTIFNIDNKNVMIDINSSEACHEIVLSYKDIKELIQDLKFIVE